MNIYPSPRGDSYDLAVSVRSDTTSGWSEPVNLGYAINTAGWESRPFLSRDGQWLYFAQRQVASEFREYDLWQASVLPFATAQLSGDGGSYTQDFNSLGTDSTQAGTPLPSGWTFTGNDVIFNDSTTRSFPTVAQQYAGIYNAGADGDTDRTLVTDVTRNEKGELDFRATITESPLQALRLGFDIEAWQVRSGVGTNLGEAAFDVVLEADSGSGFQKVADLGEFSTGKTLARPSIGNLVDGNDPAYRRSFDTGPIDVDVPIGATLRTRWISTDKSRNVVFGLDNLSLRFASPGDSNIDGAFDSTDLVQVFQAGEYEDTIVGNSLWSDGDWNNDQEFDSGDLVAAFQTGKYEQPGAVTSAVPEPTSWLLALFGLFAFRRRSTDRVVAV